MQCTLCCVTIATHDPITPATKARHTNWAIAHHIFISCIAAKLLPFTTLLSIRSITSTQTLLVKRASQKNTMKTILSLAALAAAISTSLCEDLIRSAPFRLVLESENPNYHGIVLNACHEGAAVERFCIEGGWINEPRYAWTTFYHNVSASHGSDIDIDVDGYLCYDLITPAESIPSRMAITSGHDTNAATLILAPAEFGGSLVSFDESGYMYLRDHTHGSTDPGKFEQWYICNVRYLHTQTSLVWANGELKIPSCVGVRVRRVFD